MAGLRDTLPQFQFGGYNVTPDEIDINWQYVVMNPSVDPAFVGTAIGGAIAAGTLVNTRLDYPRNLLVSLTGGTVGGTAVVRGQDQFGGTVTESIGVATAAAGGTTAGSLVFSRVGTVSYTAANGNTGTLNVGVAIGTSTNSPLFGLPYKLGGTTDIKAITWNKAGTASYSHDASAAAVTRVHAFKGTTAVAVADGYVVSGRSSYNAAGATDINTL